MKKNKLPRSDLIIKAFIFSLVLVLFRQLTSTSSASSVTITTSADWQLGQFSNIETRTKEGELRLESTGIWGAQSWKTPDKSISVGSAFASDGNYLYVFRGVGDTVFWRYQPSTDQWVNLAKAPRGAYYGADLQFHNGEIYALFGGYQKEFARYSITNDSWEFLAEIPNFPHRGASLTSNGSHIYAIVGNTTQEFYRYDVTSNTWTPLAPMPSTAGQGADLNYVDVNGNGNIYTPRGLNTTTFWRYEIATNTWYTDSPNMPLQLNDDIDTTTDGRYIFIARQQNSSSFMRYDTIEEEWTQLVNAPYSSYYAGVQYFAGDNYVYFFRGYNQQHFWKYDIDTNQFVGPNDAPNTLYTGSDMVYYNGDFYVPRGYNTTTFYRYSPGSNQWTELAPLPSGTFYDDMRGVAAGNYLYFFRGSGYSTFYRYEPGNNTWTTMTDAPAIVRYGGALAYPGGDHDYIYATRGANTSTFWRYHIDSNTWYTDLPDIPNATVASYGSTLLSNGTDLFFTAGRGLKKMYKYNISSGQWQALADLPFSPYYGTDTAYADGKILALAGQYKTNVYEYDITGNSWRELKPLAGFGADDRGPYAGASIAYDELGENFYVTRAGARAEMLTYSQPDDKYEAEGIWTSHSIDLQYVASWVDLSLVADIPSDANVTVYTRTSEDDNSWLDSWQEVINGTISSAPARYLQIKIYLHPSTDRQETPVLSSLNIEYVGDTNDPDNVSNVTAFSQLSGGEELTSGEVYRHLNPYFSWPAAQDAETQVTGYYVYFGADEAANATIDGTFQSNNNYVVQTALTSGPNFLRIATQDLLGNTSSSETVFVYYYAGIAPALNLSVNEASEFLGDFTSSTNILNNRLQLDNVVGGFWLENGIVPAPATIQWTGKNAAYLVSTNKLYLFRGANTTNFYEYDVASNVWTELAPAPAPVQYGGAVVEGPSGFLYAMRGVLTTDFWLYDIENNMWSSEVARVPLTVGYGGDMVFDGDQSLYVTRGNNTNTFWRYDTGRDEWNVESAADFGAPTNNFTNNIYQGGDLSIDRENQKIYAIQGSYNPGFSVFDINTARWEVLPNVPVLPTSGSGLAYDPQSQAVYCTAGGDKTNLYRYDPGSEQWTELNSSPSNFAYGGGIHLVEDYLMGIRGGNSTTIYKYDIAKDSWLVPSLGLFGHSFEGASLLQFNYGSDLVKGDGDNFYMVRGNYGDEFVRWNQSTGEITNLANLPIGLYYDASLVYVPSQNRIYLSPGLYASNFYYYDLASNTWFEETADPTPQVSNSGSSMIYDGTQYIYWSRGGNTTTVARFDTLSETPGSKWQSITNSSVYFGWGSEFAIQDGYLYALRGNNVDNNDFVRYDLNGVEGWTSLSNFPGRISYGSFLANDNDGYLYAPTGNNTYGFYRYSIAENSWEQIMDVPAQVYIGGAGRSNFDNKIFAIPGSGTNAYRDAIYTYVLPTDHSGFVEEGAYISQVHDLTSVYLWADLSVQLTEPTNSNVVIETCSADVDDNWEDCEWVVTDRKRVIGDRVTYRINSPEGRYLKIKFNLFSTDGVASPSISQYAVNYYQDVDPPTNPADEGLEVLSQEVDGQLLVSEVWYNHPNPYFSWPEAEASYGASDGVSGSGIAGYYVYFGPEEEADPVVDGVWQIENNFTASNLEDGQIYYLRIKASDDAAKVAENTWSPFIYQFDSQLPTAPADLTVDPSGFTSANSFNFTWSAVEKNGAPISEYCYKTGASEGEYASDQCFFGTELSSIPAYRVGTNTFYVRVKDEAGNYSDYANINYFYADISAAPAPPRNLSVDPETSTSNLFSFTWDAPAIGTYLGSESNLSYYYSVNALPSQFSTSATSLKYLNPGAYATLPGENIFYIVTKDEAGNINYSNYTQVSFFANTVAPGIPMDVEIADVSVKSTSSWRLAVSWDEPTNVGSGVSNYQVYRSLDGENFVFHSSSGGTSFVDTKLVQQTYYYQIKACDNTNNCGAFSGTVSLYPDGRYTEAAPLVSEPTASNATTKKATISWVTARTADSRVAYGTKSGEYLDAEVSSSDQVSDHSLELSNLTPGTTYYYVTRWVDEDGNRGESEEMTFSTEPPPSTLEPIAKNIGLESAIIEFTSKNASKIRIYYGESSTFGGLKEISTSSEETTHTVELEDLLDGTKYFYKINAVDVDGEEYEGEIHSFETLPRPQVSNINITQVLGTAQTTLLLRWVANTEISSIVTYFPTSRPDLARDEVNIALKSGDHRMILYNLEPQQNYTIIIRGTDIAGNEAISEPQLVNTAADTRPPQVFDLNVENEIIGEGEEARAQLIVTFKTDEAASSQVEYGEGTGTSYSQRTQEDGALKTNHMIVISGLSPAKIYHLRAVTKDEAANEGLSLDKVVVTPKATENALDLVLNNLQFTFGFLNLGQ